MFSASPERFIRRKGDVVSSEPIKGTARRGKSAEEDATIINQLKSNPKELAENVMIVDLVRNDLSKFAAKNSVNLDALNEVKTFKTVHQLVSTISCQQKPNTTIGEIIKAMFQLEMRTIPR